MSEEPSVWVASENDAVIVRVSLDDGKARFETLVKKVLITELTFIEGSEVTLEKLLAYYTSHVEVNLPRILHLYQLDNRKVIPELRKDFVLRRQTLQ